MAALTVIVDLNRASAVRIPAGLGDPNRDRDSEVGAGNLDWARPWIAHSPLRSLRSGGDHRV